MTILLLFAAALLEAGGDALIRSGLHSSTIMARTSFFLVGAIVLFSYGYVVNAPPWDFGSLLGVYVVFFFIHAQLISWLVFRQRPTVPVLLGGAFILIGGFIISFNSRS